MGYIIKAPKWVLLLFYKIVALNSSAESGDKYAGGISNTVLQPQIPSSDILYIARAYATITDEVNSGLESSLRPYSITCEFSRSRPVFPVLITNPPYGERLIDVKAAEELYTVMGKRFKEGMGRKYYIISPHDEFEKFLGRPADKRRKLYNGMIKCQLFMYFKNKER